MDYFYTSAGSSQQGDVFAGLGINLFGGPINFARCASPTTVHQNRAQEVSTINPSLQPEDYGSEDLGGYEGYFDGDGPCEIDPVSGLPEHLPDEDDEDGMLPDEEQMPEEQMPVSVRVNAPFEGFHSEGCGSDDLRGYDNTGCDNGAFDNGIYENGAFDNGPFDNAPFDNVNAPFDNVNAPFDNVNAPFDNVNAAYDNGGFDNAPFDDGGFDDGAFDDGTYDDGTCDDGTYDDGGYNGAFCSKGGYDNGGYDDASASEGCQCGLCTQEEPPFDNPRTQAECGGMDDMYDPFMPLSQNAALHEARPAPTYMSRAQRAARRAQLHAELLATNCELLQLDAMDTQDP